MISISVLVNQLNLHLFDFATELSLLFSEVSRPVRRILVHDYVDDMLLRVLDKQSSAVFVFLNHVYDECRK